jgi:hypothetical protein
MFKYYRRSLLPVKSEVERVQNCNGAVKVEERKSTLALDWLCPSVLEAFGCARRRR